ncbi:MAG: histidine kinase [Clostridia bacterium]|nr:histidine kinase [Clostridia bacterium]
MFDKQLRFTEKNTLFQYIVFILLTISLGLCIVQVDLYGPENIPADHMLNITLDLFCMAVLLIQLMTGILERNESRANHALLRFICMLHLVIFLDLCTWSVSGMADKVRTHLTLTTIYYIVQGITLFCFWQYFRFEQKLEGKLAGILNRVLFDLMLLYIVTVIVNSFTGFIFTISPEGELVKKAFYPLVYLGALLVLTVLNYYIFTTRMRRGERFLWLQYEILPVIGSGIEMLFPKTNLTHTAMVIAIMIIQSNIHLQRQRRLKEQEAKLAEQNVAIMISQIQPHFLYNSLTTISNLCRKDPEAAEEVTVEFSQYLRMNLDSLKISTPIPVSRELDHVRIYLELEQRRFGDKLNVEYDIRETGFTLPALSLQPIVENSVKHGICEKECPGTVRISTEKTDKGFLVTVKDDGVGFDMNAPVKQDNRSHVGMGNVRDRLASMSHASMEIISSPGNGCETRILIPADQAIKR